MAVSMTAPGDENRTDSDTAIETSGCGESLSEDPQPDGLERRERGLSVRCGRAAKLLEQEALIGL
jgi:hypothetical protein